MQGSICDKIKIQRPTMTTVRNLLVRGAGVAAAASYRYCSSLVSSFTFSIPPAVADTESGKTYQTQYVTISYTDEKDLHDLHEQHRVRPEFPARQPPEEFPPGKDAGWTISWKRSVRSSTCIRRIFTSASVLYGTRSEVTGAYRRATLPANATDTHDATGAAPIAFYSHGPRSIVVAVDSVTDHILAHEIAHAVINAYFVIPPPARMQEILAQYMDKHYTDR